MDEKEAIKYYEDITREKREEIDRLVREDREKIKQQLEAQLQTKQQAAQAYTETAQPITGRLNDLESKYKALFSDLCIKLSEIQNRLKALEEKVG